MKVRFVYVEALLVSFAVASLALIAGATTTAQATSAGLMFICTAVVPVFHLSTWAADKIEVVV